VLFSRRQSGTPTFTPTDGTAYTAGQVFGTSVIAANTANFSTVSVFDENGPDNVIVPGTSYGYRAFTRDNNTITGAATPAPPHYSFGVNFSTTTLTPGPNDKNWSYRTGAVTLSPPGLTSTTVVVGSNDARLHGMNSTSGGRLYQPTGLVGTTGGAIQARPPVIPSALTTGVDCDAVTAGVQPCDISFVGDGVGDVYAFDVATGTRVWSASMAPGGSIQGGAAVQLSIPSNSGFTPTCAPCDVVFVGSRLTADAINNSVTALNAATGAVVWTFQPGNMDIIVSTPLVDYETNSVWVSSLSNGGTQPSLWRINSSTGVLAESFSFGDISGPPEFSQIRRAVYAVTDAGVLHVIRTDVASCNYSLAAAAGTAVGGPVPSWQSNTDDDIYFVTTNTLNKFHLTLVPFTCGSDTLTDLNGAGWTNPVLSNPSGLVVTPTTPTVPTSQIFIGDDTGRIRRIDAATGAIAGSRDVELLSIIGEPSIDLANNRIYVGTSTGRIYSFNINF
jgi:outer membrane protein assembly factor BamB